MTTVIFIKGLDKYPDRAKQAGIADYGRRRGWNVQSVEAIDSQAKLKAVLDLWSPAGIIVNCGAGYNTLPPSAYGKTPVVFFAFPDASARHPVSCVYNDAKMTADLAAKTLLQLNLASYGYVNWFKPLSWNEMRRQAFCEALSLHGKPIAVFSSRQKRSAERTRAIVSWLRDLPKPIGVFAANDAAASLVANACKLSGLSVPDDVAIVGVDNDVEVCEANTPTLSSIKLNHVLSGQLAAEMLDHLMQKRSRKIQSVSYPPLGVVNRESTRRFPKTDKAIAQAVERIRKEACAGLNARDVLKDLPWSRRVAEVRFKNLTGHSILAEIRSVRLAAAKSLLRDGKSSIESIAHQTGYATLPAFSAFFKAETGLSPLAWQKRNR